MTDEAINFQGASCPLPLTHNDQIVMGHGSGGKMTHDLIRDIFLKSFSETTPNLGDDGAILSISPSTYPIASNYCQHRFSRYHTSFLSGR